jgi:hypothetical protein
MRCPFYGATYSLIMVSLQVEVGHQPLVIDSGTVFFDRSIGPIGPTVRARSARRREPDPFD